MKRFIDEHFFLGSGWRKLGWLAVLVLIGGLAVVVWDQWGAPRLWGPSIGSGQSCREMLFGMLGALEYSGSEAGVRFVRAFLLRLFSVVVFGGLLVSTLCSMMQQREERVRAGLVRYRGIRRHYVVVGWGTMAAELVAKLLKGEMDGWHPVGAGRRKGLERYRRWAPRVVLYTASDVESVRGDLEGQLPAWMCRRIVFYRGGLDLDAAPGEAFDRLFKDLGVASARQVYLLGDSADVQGRDAKILAFTQGLSDRLGTPEAAEERRRAEMPDVLPVYAELDGRDSRDYAKRLDFVPPKKGSGVKMYFRPFSFHELWARRLFAVDSPWRLDNRPMGPEDWIHFVVVGFNRMGEALTLEALRACHYPGGQKTRITVIDRAPPGRRPLEAEFRARYPYLAAVEDVSVDFLASDVASSEARALLKASAEDPRCLMTVAVCPEDSDLALSLALGLPEEVYRRGEEGKDVPPHRARWKTGGNQVWVRQNLAWGGAKALPAQNGPYARVMPFGMISEVLTERSFAERTAMYHHALWSVDGADKVMGMESKCRVPEKRREWLDDAFRKYVGLGRENVWANLYVEDSYGAILRALGLRAVRAVSECQPADDQRVAERIGRNEKHYPVELAKLEERLRARGLGLSSLRAAEHRRWIAERSLMGYRAPGIGEVRDNAYRIHDQIKPYASLDEQNVGKDDNNVRALPIILALEGFVIEDERVSGVSAREE